MAATSYESLYKDAFAKRTLMAMARVCLINYAAEIILYTLCTH